MKQQAALRRLELQRAGKQQIVFRAVFGPWIAESCLLQTDALADHPAAKPMPDQQQALAEEMVRVPQLCIVEAQAHPFVFAAQAQVGSSGEQAVKQQAAIERAFQVAAVDHRMTHHRETAGFARGRSETQVFVVQCQPQSLDQPGELLGRDACTRFVEQFGADPQSLQQVRIVVPTLARPSQGGAGEMTGDGAFAHRGRSVR
ncbi:hypothetical protein D3C85_1289520 [compost metagenome]